MCVCLPVCVCLHVCDVALAPPLLGESRQVEEPRWSHGRPDDQWGAGDAPEGRVHGGVEAGSVEGGWDNGTVVYLTMVTVT